MVSDFSAASSALGYLYQIRQALLLILAGPEDAEVSIERFDDIAVETEGGVSNLVQLKHQKDNPKSLSDLSSDLWKTIRIWSYAVGTGKATVPGTIFSLITTGQAADGSIAALLRSDSKARNEDEALRRLIEVTFQSQSTELRKCFEQFLALSTEQRRQLVAAVRIFDNSPNIQDVAPEIKRYLLRTVFPEHREALFERLEGWWSNAVISHLIGNADHTISAIDVNLKIVEYGRQFSEDNLPVDFRDVDPPFEVDPQGDQRLFVRQLRAIRLRNRRIDKAIRDYYKAFEQRSRWVREELLINGEFERYEKKLIDEWERHFDELADSRDGTESCTDDQLIKSGQQLYKWMEQEAELLLRPKLTEEYVMRGTFHLLADRLKDPADSCSPTIWWHPRFVEMLREALAEPR